LRILFLAPQPYFQERGTTIAIDLLLKTLAQRGDTVDVLTFHVGENREYPNVTLSRVAPPFAPATITPGFSWSKIYCDVFLFRDAIKMIRRERYDLVYAVEEAVFMAMVMGKFTSIPYVFDMDSSMADQLVERYRWMRPAASVLRWVESLPMRGALAVVPMCEYLAQQARRHCNGSVHVLRDVSLLNDRQSAAREDLRRTLHIDGPLLLYIGNLKAYQGVDLLLEAFAALPETHADAHLAIIGGAEDDVAKYRRKAEALGVEARTHLLGPRPVEALGDYLRQADLLISPRISGANTPMKVYSYLDSGVAVVATALPTHTQVMTEEHAGLAAPEPEAMAQTIARLLDDPEERVRLAARARALVRREHSREAFRRSAHAVFNEIESRLTRDPLAKRMSVEP